MSRANDEPVVIARADNEVVGQMWRELLANNGIVAMLFPSGPLGGIADFATPHDLLVAPVDADRARDLLAAFDQDEEDQS